MDLLSLIIGIVIGAAFSPFWIKLFNFLKELILGLIEKMKREK